MTLLRFKETEVSTGFCAAGKVCTCSRVMMAGMPDADHAIAVANFANF